MLVPNSTTLKINIKATPLLLTPSYHIDNSPNNPSLLLYRGYTYQFAVNVPTEHGFRVKTKPGALQSFSYDLGITNNGISSGYLTWKVDSTTPTNLVYQSPSTPALLGLITIGDIEQDTAVKPLATSGDRVDTLADLVNAVNNLYSSVLTIYDPVAGDGLMLVDKTLSLTGNSNTQYLRDVQGNLIRTVNVFSLDDSLSANANFDITNCTLQQVLNYVVYLLRQIKDSSKAWNSSPSLSLSVLQSKYDSLLAEVLTLQNIVQRHTQS